MFLASTACIGRSHWLIGCSHSLSSAIQQLLTTFHYTSFYATHQLIKSHARAHLSRAFVMEFLCNHQDLVVPNIEIKSNIELLGRIPARDTKGYPIHHCMASFPKFFKKFAPSLLAMRNILSSLRILK